MPSSREIKARQQRQREKIAELHIERDRKRRRNAWLYGVGGFLVFVLVVGGIIWIGTEADEDGNPNAAPPPKQCVATKKGELPKGAPKVDVQVGEEPTKLFIKDLKEGTGAVVAKGDTVSANLVGVQCSTGTVFVSTWEDGKATPQPIDLENADVKGWQEGIPGMKVGGQRLLGVPADLAYGSTPPQGSGVGTDEPLWFVVKVESITPAES